MTTSLIVFHVFVVFVFDGTSLVTYLKLMEFHLKIHSTLLSIVVLPQRFPHFFLLSSIIDCVHLALLHSDIQSWSFFVSTCRLVSQSVSQSSVRLINQKTQNNNEDINNTPTRSTTTKLHREH
ncbi:uncharacterized protein B0T23DRAFT_43474 [Neurospora hispaniola]|uniref:Uncharacterized protein n=1 Tax=Neurospora hispaniola TaxID=588809 RepID=A0AAJ0HYV9_9PEZI|nr:hypothetical protein B0T23DRAFT_43474 [Neurospora hispaniola]